MKDYFFFKSEKEKKSYDRFLKKKGDKNQIFILSLMTLFLLVDSIIYLITWLLDSMISNSKFTIIIAEMIKIIGFSLALLIYYITKRYFLKKITHNKVIYIDIMMFFLKMAYLIIFLEAELNLFVLLMAHELDATSLFFILASGMKISLIEASFLINYFRWATKMMSITSSCFYVSFRIMNHITFHFTSLLIFSVILIFIILKMEKEVRELFIIQEEQGDFHASSDHFKFIFENLNAKIIEKLFNKSSEGFLFIDKEFKNFHHNDKITNFFCNSSVIPNLINNPSHINQNKIRNPFSFATNTNEVKLPQVNASFLDVTASKMNPKKQSSHQVIKQGTPEKTSPEKNAPTIFNFEDNYSKRNTIDHFLNSKLIALKDGPDFLHKFFNEQNLNIENRYNASNIAYAPKKQCQQTNSFENMSSCTNILHKYSNSISLRKLCNFFLKKKRKEKQSSFSKFHTLNKLPTKEILQEDETCALVEIGCLYFDESKQCFKEKKFEVMIFPIQKQLEITHFFFLVQDFGLETMIKQLKLECENKSKAITFVSHEMRTPLNCTKGMLHMLKEVVNLEYLEAYVLPALTSSEFLLNLLNDLLDVSQIQNGKFKLVHLEFNLKILLTDILLLFKLVAKSKGINIFFNFDDKIPEIVKSDANRIRQIVTNLLGNALKFTQKGSISLHATLEPKDNTLILIQVIDTGLGIKDENKEKLFQAFGKVDSNENEYLNSQGVGLGLLISNILAKNLGPSFLKLKKLNLNAGLNMTSKYGDGTTFKFLVEDKNETDVLSRGTRGLAQVSINNDFKLIEFVNQQRKKKECNSKENSESENEDKDKDKDKEKFDIAINSQPCRKIATRESLKRPRKSRSFIPQNFRREDLRDSVGNFDKKLLSNKTKTLVFNDILSSSFHQREGDTDDVHLESDADFIKKILIPCQNNCPKILICDDDYFNLVVLENFLQELKVKLEKAYNGAEAIEKVKNLFTISKCCKTFDLIFMDIEMPEKNGMEACIEIKRFFDENKGKKPIIIATTGHSEREEVMKIMESGMNDNMSKPISKKDLMKIIKKVLLNQQQNFNF